MKKQEEFERSIFFNKILYVKNLLKNKKVDPSYDDNWAIIFSSKKRLTDIVKLLWEDQIIKNTLKNDNIELYNKLIQQDITNKVSEF